jgi:hypothetical protein
MKALLLSILSSVSVASASTSPISVSVDFVEALAPRDTTSSERFQREYENAISVAKTLTEQRLKDCGFKLETQTAFFDASDSIQALEKGKASEARGAWLIVGPRRSNHYVLLAKGVAATPTVSTMASSDEVAQLGTKHVSVVVNNRQMAIVAAKEARKKSKLKHAKYVSVVSQDCVTCIDFASHFDKAAKSSGMKRVREVLIAGEAPALDDAIKAVKELKPSFILLPNYSKVSAQVIAALHAIDKKVYFVGGDGWGDSKFGFVQDAKSLESAEGITVRGFPSSDEALKKFKLGQSLLQKADPSLPTLTGGPMISLLRIIEGTVDLLCAATPKSKDDFARAFERNSSRDLKPLWGVSVYTLKGGNISFQKMISERE